MTTQRVIVMFRHLIQYQRTSHISTFSYFPCHSLLGERILKCTRPLFSGLVNNHKFMSSQQPKQLKIQKTENKFSTYLVDGYKNIFNEYQKSFETKFPKATKLYKIISIGIKKFITDFKMYIIISMKLKNSGFSKMTHQELELYQRMPIEIRRIAPIFILSAIPFGNYIVFPLAFLKPKALLCSHFWSVQQRIEFHEQDLKERLGYHKQIFAELQSKLDSISDNKIKTRWEIVLDLLKKGGEPTIADILECKILFCKEPYQLEKLTFSHLGHLIKMFGYKQSLYRYDKLKYIALLLLEMDKAIIREGGIDKLSPEALQYACYIRGLNTSNISNQDMKNWLKRWLTLSTKVDKDSYSLILHGPILLGPNEL